MNKRKLFFKFKNLFFALVYALSFILAYHNFLYFHFEYAGYEINNNNTYHLVLSVLISIIPIFFYRGFNYISGAISAFIYILLYVPIIISFYFISKTTLAQTINIQLIFFISMIILFSTDYIKINFKQISSSIKPKYILIIGLFLSIYMLIVYRSNLQFVSFYDVYKLRADNNQLGNDLFTRYLSSWLYNFFIPISLSYGLIYKKKWGLFIGIIGCVIIYMATGSKAAILLPFIYFGVFMLIRKGGFNFLQNSLKLLSLIIIILLFIDFNFFSSILLSRTIGNGGLITYWYYDYFTNHPITHFSHLNIVNLFFQNYPYGDRILGQVVGQYYWSEEMNANANFWATDGIASFGVYGVIIITIIVSVFLIFLKEITRKHNKQFVLLCFLPFILSLTNTSFFSSLLTGGGAFLMIFFMFKQKIALYLRINKL